jgi:hypothetical protein
VAKSSWFRVQPGRGRKHLNYQDKMVGGTGLEPVPPAVWAAR